MPAAADPDPGAESDESATGAGSRRPGDLEHDDSEVLDGELAGDGEDDGGRRVSISASFSGPLPHPDVLGRYNDVVPGLAEDIVEQWKAETRHRHETVTELRKIDRDAMEAFYAGEKRGQIFGLIGLVLVVALAALAIALDRPAVGVASLITAAATAIWAMRRRSVTGSSEPVELDDPDQVANKPAPVDPDR